MATGNRVVREGVSAGLIGATSIAVWFAILDLVNWQLLATPVMLGKTLGSYTLFHFAIFIAIGIAFSFVVNGAERVPSTIIGFGMLFVAFEVGWVGWTMVLAQGFGELTWLQVFIANLIASVAMGTYMWRQHPSLPRHVTQELAGVTE